MRVQEASAARERLAELWALKQALRNAADLSGRVSPSTMSFRLPRRAPLLVERPGLPRRARVPVRTLRADPESSHCRRVGSDQVDAAANLRAHRRRWAGDSHGGQTPAWFSEGLASSQLRNSRRRRSRRTSRRLD